MRRAVVAALALAVLASGCGGGGSGERGASGPDSAAAPPSAASAGTPGTSDAGSGATVRAGISAGGLGGAVVARPGQTSTRARPKRITPKDLRLRIPSRGGAGVGAEAGCADADLQPTPQNLSRVSVSIFCLMNAMRANAGVPALRQQDQLAKASLDHSQDMVDQQYFAHDSLDGRDLVARLRGVAYIPKTGQWIVGENLAWGAGTLATAKALVNAWMNSAGHRQNLLSPDFAEVGMGVVYGTPDERADDGVTVTTDFGSRPGAVGGDAADDSVAAVAGAVTRQVTTSRRRSAARRKRALRRCTRKHGKAKRRCVRAARRIR